MTWVKIDDHFDEHPKLAKVGPLGWGYWLAGIAYCNRNLTDGFIPWSKARTLASFEIAEDDGKLWELSRSSGYGGNDIEADWIIDLLVGAGLWEVVENGRGGIDGYRIHDYEDYQPTREHVETVRETRAEAGRKGGLAKAKQVAKQNSSNVSSKAEANAKQNSAPYPIPDPGPGSQTQTESRKTEGELAANAPAREDVNFSPEERQIISKVRQVKGLASVSECDVGLHLREVMAARDGPPLQPDILLAEAIKFRDYHQERRKSTSGKWRQWRNAVTNWFTRINSPPRASPTSRSRIREPDFSGIEAFGQRMDEIERRKHGL